MYNDQKIYIDTSFTRDHWIIVVMKYKTLILIIEKVKYCKKTNKKNQYGILDQ